MVGNPVNKLQDHTRFYFGFALKYKSKSWELDGTQCEENKWKCL